MKKLILKILSLFLAALFFQGFALGEQPIISEGGSVNPNAAGHSDHSYFFVVQQQAENRINTSRLLTDVQLSESQDHSFEGGVVETIIQRRLWVVLHGCRIVNQSSELTKLIYPFHFFF